MLVIDNISVPFRTLYTETLAERVDAIRALGLRLRHSDVAHQRTFLYVSHLTTRFLEPEKPILVPSLGENWAVMCDMEILLEQLHTRRTMTLIRSDLVDFGQHEVSFRITVSARGVPVVVLFPRSKESRPVDGCSLPCSQKAATTTAPCSLHRAPLSPRVSQLQIRKAS